MSQPDLLHDFQSLGLADLSHVLCNFETRRGNIDGTVPFLPKLRQSVQGLVEFPSDGTKDDPFDDQRVWGIDNLENILTVDKSKPCNGTL
ncbi:hypothetical protein WICPIJ_001728 [Wickerhamomyces pijperi]|uniref:Uncharacterized protein n=1 Tax=Wickerhamomyces pijperi TaxID=599730 RepID=A0A9P8TQG8_WICPI|nr:hypothetical protein WICPIJ_001728 [Wickerhamomyces pijperi]